MFYGLATNKIDTGDLRFEHMLEDIQTLNEKATRGVYDVTAVSFHAYAYISDKYALLPHGASIGEGYGPIVVAREPYKVEDITKLESRRARHDDERLPRAAHPLARVRVRGRPLRPDHRGRAEGRGRRRPAHPRGAALLPEARAPEGRRPRRVVEGADGAAAADGRQRHPPRPRRGDRPARLGLPARVDPVTRSTTAATRSPTPCSSRATWTRSWPTASSGCGSTSSRSTTPSAAARAVQRLLDEGFERGVIPHRVEAEFVG